MKSWIARDIEIGTNITQNPLKRYNMFDSLSINMIYKIMIGFMVSFDTFNSPSPCGKNFVVYLTCFVSYISFFLAVPDFNCVFSGLQFYLNFLFSFRNLISFFDGFYISNPILTNF